MHCELLTLFIFAILPWFSKSFDYGCSSESLAVYEVVLETFWDRRDFPKHYPEWRPPASWSKMIGYSHGPGFKVFQTGELASDGLKAFAETATSNLLDHNTQGSKDILDSFNGAPISTGVGKSKVSFSADGNHSKVSLVTKMVPSPDWFVGINSYDLCPNGQWLEYVHLEAGPLDAGTDNGLTFTSPNWPSDPPEKIHKITKDFPDHPAGSFNYPHLQELPTLAHFTLIKQREYLLKKDFDAADPTEDVFNKDSFISFVINDKNNKKQKKTPEDDLERFKNRVEYITSNQAAPKILPLDFDTSANDVNSPLKHNHVNSVHNKAKNDFASYEFKGPSKFKKQLQAKYQNPTSPAPSLTTTSVTEATETEKVLLLPLHHLQETPLKKGASKTKKFIKKFSRKGRKKKIPTGDAMAVIDDIVKNYQRDHRRELKKRRRTARKRRREQFKKIRPPRDCRVSEWSEWSPCSKTCGIGEQTRTRRTIKRAKRGGKPCPPLEETTWCGSARACQRVYFDWAF